MARRMLVVFVTVLGAVGLGAVPASADKPVQIIESFSFVDLNPCSGEDHVITINVDVSLHSHGEREVVNIRRTGTTDSGYVMNPGGREHVVNNGNFVNAWFNETWGNDAGSKIAVKGRFKLDLDTGETLVDKFQLTCAKP